MTFARFKKALLLFGLLFVAACPSIENATEAQSRVPNYCSASLVSEQAGSLNRLVVAAFNESMQKAPGFSKAKANLTQPVVDLTDAENPILYYPQNPMPFHASLCVGPQSPFFRCENDDLRKLVEKGEKLDSEAFAQFYEGKLQSFSFEAPRAFGPRHIALPLTPSFMKGDDESPISDNLHVSLVKIISAKEGEEPSEASAALREKFVKALEARFAKEKAQLPSMLEFDDVSCSY